MYIFIAALLINSLLLSSSVYPLLLVDFLSKKQIISYSAYLFQFDIFYSLLSSEFLLLAVMAYDRYVSIYKPLQYPVIMRKTTLCILLLLAWLLPVCQMAVATGFTKLQCVISTMHTIHDMIMLVNFALLPVLFILFTYTRILIISYQSSREVRKKAAQTCLPHLIILINFSCLCTYSVIIVRLESHIRKIVKISKHLKRLFYPAKIN
uniref:G-protein coupled receptors family 1 profile domain-containing protein n=1 Tax=Monopterus albus TaxID=43700 RepID=A0A3Q3IE06_MONAL